MRIHQGCFKGPEPRPSSGEAQAELRDGQESGRPFRPPSLRSIEIEVAGRGWGWLARENRIGVLRGTPRNHTSRALKIPVF
jgi:hypothetical protein